MAALISGTFKVMLRVSLVDTSTSLGNTSEAAGTNKTSSKVRPIAANLSGNNNSPPFKLNFIYHQRLTLNKTDIKHDAVLPRTGLTKMLPEGKNSSNKFILL